MMTVMGVLLGVTCMLAFVWLTQPQETWIFLVKQFCSLMFLLLTEGLCWCLARVVSSSVQVPGCCCTEQSCYRRMTCTCSSEVSSVSFACIASWMSESHWALHICLPSSHCCQHSVILTGAAVTITGSVFSAGCQSLLDHQNTNDTWLFSSRIVICIPKCTT